MRHKETYLCSSKKVSSKPSLPSSLSDSRYIVETSSPPLADFSVSLHNVWHPHKGEKKDTEFPVKRIESFHTHSLSLCGTQQMLLLCSCCLCNRHFPLPRQLAHILTAGIKRISWTILDRYLAPARIYDKWFSEERNIYYTWNERGDQHLRCLY